MGFRADLVEDVGFVHAVLGGGLFVAEEGGETVGVASALSFGATGWLGGIAVPPGRQRRGIGHDLTRTAMDWLGGLGVETLLLHSTAAGRRLYLKLGFKTEYDCLQWLPPDGRDAVTGDPGGPVRRAEPADLSRALAHDRAASGEDRSRVLESGWPGEGHVAGDARRGYHLPISGLALGAVIATDDEAGVALLGKAAQARPAARVALPAVNRAAQAVLEGLGYYPSSRVSRMRLGPAVDVRPERMFGLFNLYWG